MTLGNDNGMDGRTDRQTDRVRRNMRPPPREEGRIISVIRLLFNVIAAFTGSLIYLIVRRHF